MANCNQLKTISKARLKSAEILMNGGDWEGAAYMLGYVLECALKAAVCKTLGLNDYPSERKKDSHFMTHNLDQLLVLSGMSSIFSGGGVLEEIQSWSEFTKEFLGDWPAMRYSLDHMQKFDETKVRALHLQLIQSPNGILSVVTRRRKW